MVINGLAISQNLQFRSKSIVCYQQAHGINGSFSRSASFLRNAELLKSRKKYTGEITKGAKKRLTKAISLLVQASPEKWIWNPVTKTNQSHKLSFITLTLPDIDAAKDAKFTHKYLLQPMLRILRNKYKMSMYVWKCELQKNDSIHYHLTTELFIPWEQLRQHWNALLRKNGMLEAFQKQYGHDNPNSVDIHSVNKVNDLEAYLVKYISKEYQNSKKLAGKVWDCSKNLKESTYFTTTLTYDLHQQILKEIDLGWLQPIYRDRCIILKSRTTDYYQSFSRPLIEEYYKHLNSILTWENNGNFKSGNNLNSSLTKSQTLSTTPTAGQSNRRSSYGMTCGQRSIHFQIYSYEKYSTTSYGMPVSRDSGTLNGPSRAAVPSSPRTCASHSAGGLAR